MVRWATPWAVLRLIASGSGSYSLLPMYLRHGNPKSGSSAKFLEFGNSPDQAGRELFNVQKTMVACEN